MSDSFLSRLAFGAHARTTMNCADLKPSAVAQLKQLVSQPPTRWGSEYAGRSDLLVNDKLFVDEASFECEGVTLGYERDASKSHINNSGWTGANIFELAGNVVVGNREKQWHLTKEWADKVGLGDQFVAAEQPGSPRRKASGLVDAANGVINGGRARDLPTVGSDVGHASGFNPFK